MSAMLLKSRALHAKKARSSQAPGSLTPAKKVFIQQVKKKKVI